MTSQHLRHQMVVRCTLLPTLLKLINAALHTLTADLKNIPKYNVSRVLKQKYFERCNLGFEVVSNFFPHCWVTGVTFHTSIFVTPRYVFHWRVNSMEDLNEASLSLATHLKDVELLLLGTGKEMRCEFWLASPVFGSWARSCSVFGSMRKRSYFF